MRPNEFLRGGVDATNNNVSVVETTPDERATAAGNCFFDARFLGTNPFIVA